MTKKFPLLTKDMSFNFSNLGLGYLEFEVQDGPQIEVFSRVGSTVFVTPDKNRFITTEKKSLCRHYKIYKTEKEVSGILGSNYEFMRTLVGVVGLIISHNCPSAVNFLGFEKILFPGNTGPVLNISWLKGTDKNIKIDDLYYSVL